MHVAPVDLRAVRQGGITIRFAMLGAMAYVIAKIPDTGSAGTSLEQPCTQPHWGMVIDGELTFVTEQRRLRIPAGRIFHVPPGGPEHRFLSAGSAMVAGFQPIDSETDVSEEHLRSRGFEIVAHPEAGPIVPVMTRRRIAVGEVRGESWRMPPFVMSRVRMGERSGYTQNWCDAPHWGIVTEGRLAIAWEDDVEILSKGDIFYCPAGPPGHRMEAADPATFIDLTPISALESDGRVADWRRRVDFDRETTRRGIAVAALG
jgi:quercetin dioxygenase-like cupin family protein